MRRPPSLQVFQISEKGVGDPAEGQEEGSVIEASTARRYSRVIPIDEGTAIARGAH